MNYQGMYERLQTLKALNLLHLPNNIDFVEEEFAPETMIIKNITPSVFLMLSEKDQHTVFQIILFYEERLDGIIAKDLLETLENLVYVEENMDFQENLNDWSIVTNSVENGYESVSTLNAIKEWNYNHPTKKVIYEKINGIPIEVVYKKGVFKQAIVDGKDITQNAIYFNGMVKELDDQMDCIITGVVKINSMDLATVNSIIEIENMTITNNVKSIIHQTKGRKEDLFECITFVADDLHITKIHHSGENVV
jgi:hypothetical protein